MSKISAILRQVAVGKEFLDPARLMQPAPREDVLSAIGELSCSEDIKASLRKEVYPVFELKKALKIIPRRKRSHFKKSLQKLKSKEAIESLIGEQFPGEENEELRTSLMGMISDQVQLGHKSRVILGKHFIVLDNTTRERIKQQELYRVLPNTGGVDSPRGKLEKAVTGEEAISLKGVNIDPVYMDYSIIALQHIQKEERIAIREGDMAGAGAGAGVGAGAGARSEVVVGP